MKIGNDMNDKATKLSDIVQQTALAEQIVTLLTLSWVEGIGY